MPDLRFFIASAPASLAQLAALTGARLANDHVGAGLVYRVAPLASAGHDAITFLADRRYTKALGQTKAYACFVAEQFAGHVPEGCIALVTPRPQAAFAMAANHLVQPRQHAHASPIHPDAEIEDGVILSPGVVIGAGAQIGSGTVIGANTSIGPGVAIGRDCFISANVTIGFALIGDRVRILAGARIGEAGFGVAGAATGAIDVPQLGRVIIQDGVTVGAGSCIDRGAFDDTVIGENTKIDNLVQIAHNVSIGRNCIIAAQTGISGSVTVGDGVAFGGQVGVADHINIGKGAQLAASAGVMKDIPEGETWGGFPARPIRRWLRETASIAQLAKRTGKPRGEGAKE
jgi:UDP-3-O-[3-hydroxymyristoyl] glucosamine N-acyltransferase